MNAPAQTAKANNLWPAANIRNQALPPLPSLTSPTSHRVPTSPVLYQFSLWKAPDILKVYKTPNFLPASQSVIATSSRTDNLSSEVARAHPMLPRAPQPYQPQGHTIPHGATRPSSLTPELAPLRPYLKPRAVSLPPINALLTQPPAPPLDPTSPLTHSDTAELVTPPNIQSEQFFVAPDGGFLVTSPVYQLTAARHTVPVKARLEEAPTSAGMKRTGVSLEKPDSSSIDPWSSCVSINTEEYAPAWREDPPAHSGTRIRQLKARRNGKRKAYGYCHYVADDFCLRDACTWVPPREICDERSEEGWFRFAERILDWRDRAMKYQGTWDERDEMVWHCNDTPSELRTKHMQAAKALSEIDELQPDSDRVTRASKRRRA